MATLTVGVAYFLSGGLNFFVFCCCCCCAVVIFLFIFPFPNVSNKRWMDGYFVYRRSTLKGHIASNKFYVI